LLCVLTGYLDNNSVATTVGEWNENHAVVQNGPAKVRHREGVETVCRSVKKTSGKSGLLNLARPQPSLLQSAIRPAAGRKGIDPAHSNKPS
jgi:hypothetical protein